jgi:type I restriction enzyme R subunit
VVEAKADYKSPRDGLQQAKGYAETLGLNFAYATNGERIVEFDFASGLESDLPTFPSPADLWGRLRAANGPKDEAASERFLEPGLSVSGKASQYYQETAVNRCWTDRTRSVRNRNSKSRWQPRWRANPTEDESILSGGRGFY